MRGKTREASPKRRQYAKYCNAVLIAAPVFSYEAALSSRPEGQGESQEGV